MDKKQLYRQIASFLKKQGAKKVAIFGSYARGEEKKNSDIDVLVNFPSSISLLDHIRIERELSEKIGKKVDLVTEQALSPLIKERIKEDLISIEI